MHYAFPFLPLEVQTSIKELIALGSIPESALDLLVARTAKALEDKTTSLQMDVERIELAINARVERIGQKLQADLQTQFGATNAMLIDVRAAQMTTHPQITQALAGVTALQKTNEDIEIWVSRLEQSFIAGRDFAADERLRIEAKFNGAVAGLDGRVTAIEDILELKPKADSGADG